MIKRISILFLLILLTACATKRHVAFDVIGDYGRAGVKTYRIENRPESDTERWLFETIAEAFDAKGYSASDDSPDFFIKYELVQTTMTRENPSPGNLDVMGGSASGAYYGANESSANIWLISINLLNPNSGKSFVESSVRVTTTKYNIDKNLSWLIDPIMKDIPEAGERFKGE